jgi:NADP-dependent 3-hydroxy acid dehydrogenase YdfG
MNRVVLLTGTSTGFGRTATETLARRGYPEYETVQNFIAAGCKTEQVMDLLLGIAGKPLAITSTTFRLPFSIRHSRP